MKHIYTYLIICIWGFFSCSSPKQSTSNEESRLLSVIEIITNSDSVSVEKLIDISVKYNLDKTSIYQWRNHFVIYDVLENADSLKADIASAYPEASIKYYESPFYIFDRKNCDNKESAKEWSHTIMTANLVQDTTLQKEYMDYHATQPENWPEVANGFCKANFQQLLIFRNDRQLMLIISIPKGENLDELNPKTTENNPRVDEWNAIMGKYQEGIEGNKLGMAWVTFSPIVK